ncbi:MAG: DUF2080 family transposase-associated protein [Candidatus Altiarchaeota archaeon]
MRISLYAEKNRGQKIKENLEVIYEKVVTAFGNSAKIDPQKKYIGKRAYVLILKD